MAAEFAALNARLTEACKTRLGELATVTLATGRAIEGVRVIVDRDRELIGTNGQISDHRVTVQLAKADVGAEVKGAKVRLATSGEEFYCDALVGDDGEFVEVAVR